MLVHSGHINSLEVHPQLSHKGHPVDGAVVGQVYSGHKLEPNPKLLHISPIVNSLPFFLSC